MSSIHLSKGVTSSTTASRVDRKKLSKRLALLSAAVAGMGLFATAGSAATQTWNGGAGNWDDVAKWTPGVTKPGTGDDVIFVTATANTVTLRGAEAAKSLAFNLTGFTLAGLAVPTGQLTDNALTLDSGATITVGTGMTGTITGRLLGTDITTAGTGILVLNNNGDSFGSLVINGGINNQVQMGTANALRYTTAVTVNAGGNFNLNNQSQVIGSIAGAGTVTLGTGTLTTGFDNTTTTFSGLMGAATTGQLVKVGTGTTNLTGSLAYTGNTTVQAGELALSGTAMFNSGTILVNPGATLTLDNTSTERNRLNGKALQIFDANLNYLGNTAANSSLTAGALTVGPGQSIVTITSGAGRTATLLSASMAKSGGGNMLVRGTNLGSNTDASMKFTAVPAFVGNTFTTATTNHGILPYALVSNSATADFDANSSTVGFATYDATNGIRPLLATEKQTMSSGDPFNNLLGYSGTNNANNLVLTAQAYQMGLSDTINSLELKSGGGIRGYSIITAPQTLTVSSGGIIARTGNIGIAPESGSFYANYLNSGQEWIIQTLGASTSLTIQNIMQGSNGLSKNGPGTLILSASNLYTGQTTVNNGTLRLSGAATNNVIVPNQNLVVNNGGTLDLNGKSQFVASLLSTGAWAGAGGIVTSSGGSLLMANSNGTFAGSITGSLAVIKSGANNWTLTSANSTSGAFTINGGTVILQDAGTWAGNTTVKFAKLQLNDTGSSTQAINRLGGGSSVNLRGGTLEYLGRFSTAGTQSMGAMTIQEGASTITVTPGGGSTGNYNSATLTLGALTASAAGGTVNFTGNNMGVFSLATPGLNSGNAAVFISSKGADETLMGARYIVNGTDYASYRLATGVGALNATNYPGYAVNTNLAAGVSTENIKVTATSSPVLAGPVTVNSLNVGGGTFAATLTGQTLTLASGGLLSNTGATFTGGTITAGSAINTPVELVAYINGNTTTINSVIANNGTGAVTLTKSGAGTLTLTGANTYTGATYVAQGTLNLNGAGQTVPSTSLVIDQATVTISNANGQINPAAVVTINGPGLLNLNNFNNTLAGLVFNNIGGGSTNAEVRLGGGRLTLTGNVLVDNETNLSGTPIITSDTITGMVDLNGGIRRFTVDQTDGVDAGAGSVGLDIRTALANGGIIKDGAGILQLSQFSVYTGSTTISAGVLQLGVNNALWPTSAVIVGTNAKFDTTGKNQTIGSLAASNTSALVNVNNNVLGVGFDNTSTIFAGNIYSTGTSGALLKVGTGALSLTGINAYTGATTVNNGTLSLAGLNGQLLAGSLNAQTVTVNIGGTLRADSRTGEYSNRLNGGTLTLQGGTLDIIGGLADAKLEMFAPINISSGANVVSLTKGGALYKTSLAGSSLAKSVGGVVLFRGATLGGGGSDDARVSFLTVPGAVGSTAAIGAPNAGIYPYALISQDPAATFGSSSAGFATYDSAPGMRALTPAEQSSTLPDYYYSTAQSLPYNYNLSNSASVTVSGPYILNSIDLQSGGSVDSTNKFVTALVVNSGGIIARPGNNGINTGLIQAGNNGNNELIFYTQGNLTVDALIGGGGMSKNGPGTLTLTQPAGVSNWTTVNEGTLMLSGLTAQVLHNQNLAVNGGTLDLNGGRYWAGQFQQNTANTLAGKGGTVTNTSGTRSLFAINSGTATTFGGSIAGNLDFTKSNGSTVTLTSDNPYAGTTIVNGGNLYLKDDGALCPAPRPSRSAIRL